MGSLLNYLVENGGCSIKYRVKREILQEDRTSSEMVALQNEILSRPRVRKYLAAQHEDGWIGESLHGCGCKALDASVAYLLSRGVEKDAPPLRKVVDALKADIESDGNTGPKPDKPYRTWFHGGDALDEGGRGGNKAIKAGILASLGEENHPLVQEQINIALTYLRDSLDYQTVDDFSTTNKKGIRYYKPDARLPGANHIGILSGTKCWRTPENLELVKTSISHCTKTMKDLNTFITFKSKTHFVGPFNFNWQLAWFKIENVDRDSYALVWWLRTLDGLSTLGVVREIPELRVAYDYLYDLVESKDLLYKQNDMSLKRFKDIASIEDGWKNEKNKFCDVFFLGLVTLHKAGYDIMDL